MGRRPGPSISALNMKRRRMCVEVGVCWVTSASKGDKSFVRWVFIRRQPPRNFSASLFSLARA